jgi:alkyl hydroperoxide reductase subunit F
MPIELERRVLEWTKFQLTKIGSPVKMRVFAVPDHCVFCNTVEELVGKLSEMSDKVSVVRSGFDPDEPAARDYGIERHPALIIDGKRDFGMRFSGIPMGFQFGVLVEDLVMASIGVTDLSEEAKIKLRDVKSPVDIQVFTLPDCPGSPRMARAAHKFCIENINITAEIVDVLEFKELAAERHVLETPKTVINGEVEIQGVVSERDLADRVKAFASSRSLP